MKKFTLLLFVLLPFLVLAQEKTVSIGIVENQKNQVGSKFISTGDSSDEPGTIKTKTVPLANSKYAFNIAKEEENEQEANAKDDPLNYNLQISLPGHDNPVVMIPESQLPKQYVFKASATNIGLETVNNVKLEVEVKDSKDNIFFSGESDVLTSLAADASADFVINTTCTIDALEEYVIIYNLVCDEEDDDPSNNKDYRWISANPSVFGREHDNAKLSSANFYVVPGILGQQITMSETDTLTSISFRTYSAVAVTNVKVAVVKFGSKDTTIIAVSDDQVPYNISTLLNKYHISIDRMLDGSQDFRGVVLHKDSTYLIGVYGSSIPLAYTTVYPDGEMIGRPLDNSEPWTILADNVTPIIRAHFDNSGPLKEKDLGIKSIISPKTTFPVPATMNVSVELKNFGSNQIDPGFTINYKLNDNSVVTETYTGEALSPFSSAEFTFTVEEKFFSASQNTFKIWTGLSGDEVSDNDTLVVTAEMINTRFTQNFETNVYNFDFTNRLSPWKTVDGDAEYVKSIFVNNQQVFWYGLGSGNSGKRAFQIITPSLTSPVTTEVFTPHSGKCVGFVPCPAGPADDWLISPKVRLNTNSSLIFWVKAIEGFTEQFKVLVSTTDDQPTSFIAVSGDDPLEAPSEWTKFEIPLDDYDNQEIYVAINYISNDQLLMLIDDIDIITDFADFVDAGVTKGQSPVFPVDTLLTVSIRNSGNYPITEGLTLSYTLNDGDIVSVPFDAYPINPLVEKTFSFPEKIDVTTPGEYNYKVWTTIANDIDHDNDTLEYSVIMNELADSFSLDFENFYDFSDNFYPWESRDEDNSLCYRLGGVGAEISFPNTGTEMGFIAFNPDETSPASNDSYDAHGGSKFGASIGVWNPTKQSNDWLISPKIKIEGPNAYIKLWAKSPTAEAERMNVMISTTDKLSSSFTIISDPDTIDVPNEWTLYSYTINDYIDQEVYLAIQSVSFDGHLLMLDDIKITNGEEDRYDAGVSQVISPVVPSPKDPLDQVGISVVVENFGNKDLDGNNIKVAYSLDNSEPVEKSFGTDAIEWTKSASFTFDTKINVNQAGVHTLKVWTKMDNDFDASNDTTTIEIKINQEANPYFIDFEDFYDYTTIFTPWTNLDEDMEPTTIYTISGGATLTYPGMGLPQSFVTFNPSTCVPAVVLPAHSGDKFGIVYRSVGSANDDWLISPEITMLNGESWIKFWAKGLDNGEQFRVLVSTTDNAPESFISLTNDTLLSYDDWTEYTFSLDNYQEQDIYIAIQCVSDNRLMFMVDDIEISTEEAPTSIEDMDSETLLNIYPNPATEFLVISSKASLKQVEILNAVGSIVLRRNISGYNAVINGINLTQGVYFVRIETEKGTKIDKIIIKR